MRLLKEVLGRVCYPASMSEKPKQGLRLAGPSREMKWLLTAIVTGVGILSVQIEGVDSRIDDLRLDTNTRIDELRLDTNTRIDELRDANKRDNDLLREELRGLREDVRALDARVRALEIAVGRQDPSFPPAPDASAQPSPATAGTAVGTAGGPEAGAGPLAGLPER